MEINLSKLLAKKTGKMTFKEISKFPVSSQDIAIIVDKNVAYKDIELEIKKAGGKLFLSSKVFDVYEGINIGLNKKSVAISLTFGANDRTLTDEEIAPVMKNIIERLEKQLGAELRK
jgi:phenylalanyl-tRNA synthetase beta chain